MPWTPDFWMFAKDFMNVQKELLELEDVEIFEFKIGYSLGIVVTANETTKIHEEIHEIIKNFEHWILTSEPECCENGHSWGDIVDKYTHYVYK